MNGADQEPGRLVAQKPVVAFARVEYISDAWWGLEVSLNSFLENEFVKRQFRNGLF